jgi:hypothetical protein
MRREFLKGYLLALLAEGRVHATDSPSDIFKKMLACAKQDFPAVAAEIAKMAAEQGALALGAVIKSRLEGLANTLRERGFASIWREVQETYKRGVAAKNGARR